MSTFVEEVQLRFPGCSEMEAKAVLFEATCFPCGTIEQILAQLEEAAQSSGRDPLKAIVQGQETTERIMREFNER